MPEATSPAPIPPAGSGEAAILTRLLVGAGDAIAAPHGATPSMLTHYAPRAFRYVGYGLGDLAAGSADAAATNFGLAAEEVGYAMAWVGHNHRSGLVGPEEAGLLVTLIDMVADRIGCSAIVADPGHAAALGDALSALRHLVLAIAYADDDLNAAQEWAEAATIHACRAEAALTGKPRNH